MEQKFKKIIQKTKVWNQGLDPINHTFEGALFQDASWVFAFDESVETMKVAPAVLKAAPISAVAASIAEKKNSLSLVLFLGDSFIEGSGDDLLGKMIQAMKLRPGEFNRFSFNEKLEDVNDLSKNLIEPTQETQELLEIIKKYKPEVVVSLGATVTNILLGKREKLSGIHGQFFDKKIDINNESYTYALTPIFHPDFLIINPNMKRTAWIDLQKVMERVGKI